MAMDSGYKSGFVVLLGKPNVGKSTLLNKLVGQHISITADKPQTTRNRIRGIISNPRYQAVILDTPGVHLPKNELHRRIVNYAIQSVRDSDLVFFLTEPLARNQKTVSTADQLVLQHLSEDNPNTVLVINKIDAYEEEQILRSITVFNKEYEFCETVPVSALKGLNIDVLKSLFLKHLPVGIPYFPEDQLTDTPERAIAGELVREQIMRLCFQEIPYGVAVWIDAFRESEKVVKIFATVFIEKPSHKKIVIGKNGLMLKKIGINSRVRLERMLGNKVYLSLHVKVARNWMNNPKKLSEFGYAKT